VFLSHLNKITKQISENSDSDLSHSNVSLLSILAHKLKFKDVKWPDAAAQACNLSYSGGGDWKDHISRQAWAKGL
jgi:hypothetical protein